VRINFSKDLLLNGYIFEDAFLCVFGVLERLFQSFRWLDSVGDDVWVPNRTAELIQALADQGRSPSQRGLVAIEESYREARASENNGPSATDKADADYCDFSRHFRSMFSLYALQILKFLSIFFRAFMLARYIFPPSCVASLSAKCHDQATA
jgi:hypothetical protein